MKIRNFLVIVIFLTSMSVKAFDSFQIKTSDSYTKKSEASKVNFALNCYAANYIFLQYLSKFPNENLSLKIRVQEIYEFYAKFAVVNRASDSISEIDFEKINLANLTKFNKIQLNEKEFNFKNNLWFQAHICDAQIDNYKKVTKLQFQKHQL
jgi:hypothetical protein